MERFLLVDKRRSSPADDEEFIYLAIWPNVALAGAFHADGQRDRDYGDRGKPT